MGWGLAALGMLLVSTDSLFVRLAETSAWNVAFLVAAFSLGVQLLLHRRFGRRGLVEEFRQHRSPMLTIAALSAVSQIAFFSALTRTAVANVVVIVAATPIVAALIGWAILGERTTRRVWQAIVITMVGVVIVVAGSLGSPSLDGDILAVVAIVTFAGQIVVWRSVPNLDRFATLALGAVFTLLVTSIVARPFDLPLRAYLATAAMGLVFNAAGKIAYSTAPRFAPPAEIALFAPIETVAATTWAWLAFQEAPSTPTVIGAIVILAGVFSGTVAA